MEIKPVSEMSSGFVFHGIETDKLTRLSCFKFCVVMTSYIKLACKSGLDRFNKVKDILGQI